MENTQCPYCKHYWGDLKCAAFPEGIPDEIMLDGEVHDKPTAEQKNDIVFEEGEGGQTFSPA